MCPSKAGERWPLPWPKIVGLRNVIVHDYDEVDLDLVWQIAQNDLPFLVEQLRAICAEVEPS